MIKKIREALKKSLFNNEKGFTLIELLVVIVILGILAVIVIPKFTGSTADAKNAANKTNVATIEAAAERYYVEHNDDYPTIEELVDGGYLKETPKTPDGGDYTINPTTGKVTY